MERERLFIRPSYTCVASLPLSCTEGKHPVLWNTSNSDSNLSAVSNHLGLSARQKKTLINPRKMQMAMTMDNTNLNDMPRRIPVILTNLP